MLLQENGTMLIFTRYFRLITIVQQMNQTSIYLGQPSLLAQLITKIRVQHCRVKPSMLFQENGTMLIFPRYFPLITIVQQMNQTSIYSGQRSLLAQQENGTMLIFTRYFPLITIVQQINQTSIYRNVALGKWYDADFSKIFSTNNYCSIDE